MLEKVINQISKPIQEIIQDKDWNALEFEVEELLDQIQFNNSDEDNKLFIQIACIWYWLITLKEVKIANRDLAYWCWLHHDAFTINDFIACFEVEPIRTELITEDIEPLLDIWWELAGIDLRYPALKLPDHSESEDWQAWEEEWDAWGIDEGLNYWGRDINAAFGDINAPIPVDENDIVFPAWMIGSPYYPEMKVEVNDRLLTVWKK